MNYTSHFLWKALLLIIPNQNNDTSRSQCIYQMSAQITFYSVETDSWYILSLRWTEQDK